MNQNDTPQQTPPSPEARPNNTTNTAQAAPTNIYPYFKVENNANPSRFLNFPYIGITIKLILIIPILIELLFLSLLSGVLLIINWFIVLFTGNYWDTAYRFFVGILNLSTKIALYIYGITDKYPGFGFNADGIFELTIQKPTKPNRWLSIPFIGILIRYILLIPYFIFSNVLTSGVQISLTLSWFVILFKKRLPESFYEFERDSVRVTLAISVYALGLSDKYPSFHISMNHQKVKILLLIAGALLTAWRLSTYAPNSLDNSQKYQYQQYNDYTPQTNNNYTTY